MSEHGKSECSWFTSKYQDQIGADTCLKLWGACDDLYEQANLYVFTLSRLKEALINPNFATIRAIHTQLQTCESTAKIVPNFLMDRFIRSHGAWLLVLIAALDEPIPKPYGTVSVECLGYACQIPAIIKRVC
jgi:hypothetical protein